MTVAAAQSFYVEQVRNVTVVCFTVSSLNKLNYETVSEELLDLVAMVTTNGPIQVVVELSAVHRIDDLGLAMLRAFNDSIRDFGGTIILCRMHPVLTAAIHEAELTSEFEIRTTRGEAMWSF